MAKVVAVDFDDVLADSNTVIAEYHNTHHGTSYTRDDIKVFNLNEIWGVSKEESIPRFDAYVASEYHDRVPLITGVREALSTLRSEGWGVVVITARPERYLARTKEWLEANLSGLYDEVVCTSNFEHPDSSVTKSKVAHDHGAVVFIEDSMSQAAEISSAGIPVLLFDTPWNQEVLETDRIHRVFSWTEALNWIKNNFARVEL